MKGIHIFGMIAAFFALIVILMWMDSKREYEWDPTFGARDDEPFGCKLFDQMASRSMGDRYLVDTKLTTLNDLRSTQYDKPQGWIFMDYKMFLSARETNTILSMARRGDCILLGSNTFSKELRDSIHLSLSYSHGLSDADKLKEAMKQHDKSNFLIWKEKKDTFAFHDLLANNTMRITKKDMPHHVLAYMAEDATQNDHHKKPADRCVAISIPIGKGELIVVNTPLIFTNYGMLSERGAEYIFRFLSRFGNKPVHRIQLSTIKKIQEGDSLAMLEYIKSQPPLWWAWCLTISLIVLFMLTTARRRQRVIPVKTPPANHAVEFVRLIGTLYSLQNNHADLLGKKYHYTVERLRRELHIDISNEQEDRQSADVIAMNSQLSTDEAVAIIQETRQQVESGDDLSARKMRQLVDRLNSLYPNKTK